jgi:glycosyltransferase involved in cell wall biosynthesis
MKLTVAIPHYNSLDTLWKLIEQFREDNFDQIVVLDDGSRIPPTKLEAEFPSVTFHYSTENAGAGANRNRILDIVDEGIVWFVDADMEIISEGNADRIRKIFRHDENQVVGGMIYTKDGQEMRWNYGHEMHPVHDARFEELAAGVQAGEAFAWQRLQQYGWDYSWLRPGIQQPVTRTADWVAEGSFALPIELLKKVGGYDTAFRYHEGQDLAHRLREVGAKVTFDPEIITRHLEVNVRGKARTDEIKDAQFLFFQKHWNMTREVYEQLYGK